MGALEILLLAFFLIFLVLFLVKLDTAYRKEESEARKRLLDAFRTKEKS